MSSTKDTKTDNNDSIRKQIHLKMLSMAGNSKEFGDLTVVPLGHAVSIAEQYISDAKKEARIDERNKVNDEIASLEVPTLRSDDPKIVYWQGYHEAQLVISDLNQRRLATLKEQSSKGEQNG